MSNTNEIDTSTSRAAEFRKQAQASRDRSRESWERSDTDGFMSQWASDLAARELDMKADLAESGDVWTFRALFDLDGNLINAKRIETRFGYPWSVFAAADVEQKGEILAWINESNARKATTRRANLAKKGYAIGSVKRPAYVKMVGSGTGMSGAMNVRPVIVPTDGRIDTVAEIVATFGADDTDF